MLKHKRLKVENVQEGMSVDLEDWYESQHSKEYLEKISLAWSQYADNDWHDENNEECDADDSECTCAQPDEADVLEGEKHQAILSQFLEVTEVEDDEDGSILLTVEDDPISTTFVIAKGTVLPVDNYYESDNDSVLQPTKAPMVQRVTW